MSYFVSRRSAVGKAAKTSVPKPFRADVQGLRALAVLAVVLSHVTGMPSGGFIGVDVFFVVSGFLITGLLLREYDRTGRISFTGFYKRRIKRILPASIVVILVTAVASYLLLPKSRADSSLWDAVWAFLFVGNWRFASSGTDYFQEGVAPSPLQHFWSLAVEEQFYFIWPWLLLGIFVLVARFGRRGTERTVAGILMLMVSILSFWWALYETGSNPTVAYFSTFSRAWELGIGALIAVAAPAFSRIPGVVRTAVTWAGLAGLVVAIAVISSSNAFPAPWAALPVLSTAMIIMAGTGGEARFLWPLTNSVSRHIGDMSFSLYLWHWPVTILLQAFIQSGTPLFYVVALALSGLLSFASYHLVENPVRKSDWLEGERRSRGGRGTTASVVWVSILALTTALVIGFTFKLESDRNIAASAAISASSRIDQINDQLSTPIPACQGAAVFDPELECSSEVPTALEPSIDQMANDGGNGFKCWSNEGEEMKSCSYGGHASGGLKMAIVGDSHAGSLIPALTHGIESKDWTLDTYVGNGCQWRAMAADNKYCGAAMQQIQERLVESEMYDVVLTTASRTKTGSDKAAAISEFREAWQPVLDRGTKVVVIADVPGVAPATIECLSRIGFDPTNNDCSTPAEVSFAMSDTLVEAAAGLQGVSVISVNDLLCNENTCPAVIGNVIVYRDAAAHLTATYAATLAPYLIDRIGSTLR